MRRKCLALLLFVLLLAPGLYSQTLFVRAGAGFLRPSNDSAHQIYGNSFPLVLDVGFRFAGKLGLAAGLEWRRDRGAALPIGQGTDEFPVRLRIVSVPVSLFYELSGQLGPVPFVVDLGAGASWNSYEETWDDFALSHSGTDWGYRLYAAADFRLLPRIGFFAQVRWETVPTGQASILDENININLGGFGLLAGLSFRLF